jgi:hypothetical protein
LDKAKVKKFKDWKACFGWHARWPVTDAKLAKLREGRPLSRQAMAALCSKVD